MVDYMLLSVQNIIEVFDTLPQYLLLLKMKNSSNHLNYRVGIPSIK